MIDTLDYKSLTKEELQYIFSDIDFPLEPMWHQLVSLAFAAKRDRVAFFHDVGTGKTLTALHTLKLWDCQKTLVVCPSSAFSSWRRDLRYHTDFSYEFLIGGGRDRKKLLKKKKDVFVINFEGLKTIYAKLFKKVGWRMIESSFIHGFDGLVLDEVHKCKNYDALQSILCCAISARADHVIGLTGTPIDKSYLELFNIFKAIDLGKSLGSNFFSYRYKYFDKIMQGSKYGRKWPEWILKEGCEEEILDRISDVTLSFDMEECFDLPEVNEIVRYLHPSDQFLQVQEDIITNKPLRIPGTNVKIGGKIKAKAHALRELPSGFIYYGENKSVLRLSKNPKIEALLDFLEDTASKVVLFYWYTEEREIIEKALRKAKIPFCSVYGGQGDIRKEEEITRFSEDKKDKVLLSQATIASEGFDAYVADVVIFFSPFSSPKMRKQCIGRIRRKGQTKKCLVVDFVLENSMEERVIERRGPRFNLVQETMEYIRDFHKSSSVSIV